MRKKEAQHQVIVITPDGSKPAEAVHTPMFGPGSKPPEAPKKDWLSRFKPAIVTAAVLFVAVSLAGYAHFDDPPQDNTGTRKVADDDYKYGKDGAVLGVNTALENDDDPPSTATTPGSTPTRNTKPSPATAPGAKPNPNPQSTPAGPAPATPTPSPSPSPDPAPPSPTPPPPAPPKTVTTSYSGLGYSPAPVTINKGDTVVFANNGLTPIWPACSDGSCDAGGPVMAGGSWNYTFDNPGTWVIQNKTVGGLLGGSVTVEVK